MTNPAANSRPATTARLLGDVGGTHIRLAWQAGSGAPFEQVQVLRCADFADIEQAIRHYLRLTGVALPLQGALGVATPITGDAVQMTNHHWQFSVRALRQALALQRLDVINDFTALALALPDLQPAELQQIGGTVATAGAPLALLGAGTGLGVSGLLFAPATGQPLPISGEGGHVTLAAETALEFAVLQRLAQQHGHVSAERVLSGPGLVDLYHALRDQHGSAAANVTEAAQVTALALQQHDRLALEALTLFAGWLGSVAGNLALTLGARGGVYIGGGIVPRLGGWFASSPFRQRFQGKGRFHEYLAPIPCWVIETAEPPALRGLARALDGTPPAIL